MKSCLLFRVDGGPVIGTGHIMRCLALAKGWQRLGGEAVFALAETTSALDESIAREHCSVVHLPAAAGRAEDSVQTLNLARAHNARWIAVDGYGFDSAFHRRIKEGGARLLCLDDFGPAEHYWADLVLNPNLYAHAIDYS